MDNLDSDSKSEWAAISRVHTPQAIALHAAVQSQAIESKELPGDLRAEDSWSWGDEASAVGPKVTYIVCEPMVEHSSKDMQTQHQQQSYEHAQSAITDSCLNSSRTTGFAWGNITCGSSRLELQHATMQQ